MYSGMSVTCGGSMIDASTSMNQMSRPGKWSRANPYAHREAERMTPGRVATMMNSVFSVQRGKSVFS